jgi:hypothetical protein
MNTLVQNDYGMVTMTENLITGILGRLTDDHLAFSPARNNPTIRELLLEQAGIQRAYIESFRSFAGTFEAIPPAVLDTPGIEELRAEFARLFAELKDVIAGISDDDLANRVVDRGEHFKIPVMAHLQIYRESILIMCGKLSVSLRALDIPFDHQWVDWIG